MRALELVGMFLRTNINIIGRKKWANGGAGYHPLKEWNTNMRIPSSIAQFRILLLFLGESFQSKFSFPLHDISHITLVLLEENYSFASYYILFHSNPPPIHPTALFILPTFWPSFTPSQPLHT